MNHWTQNAIFYHIYPLGFFGCEKLQTNQTVHRINELEQWIGHLRSLHVNALYIGPLFASSSHGYDTIDYYEIDPRLGTNEDFKKLCQKLHENQIKVILDGVFNHVGREFWAFKDVCEKKWDSPYKEWFSNLHFEGTTPYHDPFYYDSWEGHYELVKLNLYNQNVCDHLLQAVNMWIDEFDIDGLRLDAANCIPPHFFKQLKNFTQSKKKDFWLMGEVIHGDYNQWANREMLDSVTNYECYKGIYSSHNTKNYFEIAYAFNRQHGDHGIYKNLYLYNFVDNHDVDRIASSLHDPRDLKNVMTLLYTMCGIPSLYYGSEWGITGKRSKHSDEVLRPEVHLNDIKQNDVLSHIQKLGEIKIKEESFHDLHYQQIYLTNEQFVFQRNNCLIALNCADHPSEVKIPEGTYQNLLNDDILHIQSTLTIQAHDSLILKT